MKIGIILPQLYRGGVLKATKDLCLMLHDGPGAGGGRRVVLAVLKGIYQIKDDFEELLAAGVTVREIFFEEVARARAQDILRKTRRTPDQLVDGESFWVPIDESFNLLDCDAWVFASDRVILPVIPCRPVMILAWDFIQRRVPSIILEKYWHLVTHVQMPFVRSADLVVTTTPATRDDAISYAGASSARVALAPIWHYYDEVAIRHQQEAAVEKSQSQEELGEKPYIAWITNTNPHKNQLTVLAGLLRYYKDQRGDLDVHVIGPGTSWFSPRGPKNYPFVNEVRKFIADHKVLRRRVRLLGEISDKEFFKELAGARFCLHGNLTDNGTFVVVDAALVGTPSLSSRYPAMEYMDRYFGLDLTYFDPQSALDLSRSLKGMESAARYTGAESVFGRLVESNARAKAFFEGRLSALIGAMNA